jgi:hypothetical protein
MTISSSEMEITGELMTAETGVEGSLPVATTRRLMSLWVISPATKPSLSITSIISALALPISLAAALTGVSMSQRGAASK